MTSTPKQLGFAQTALARRLGVRAATISDNATGKPGKVNPLWVPLMDAIEIMTPDQRARWLHCQTVRRPSPLS